MVKMVMVNMGSAPNEPRIRRIDAHDVDPVQQELEALADDVRRRLGCGPGDLGLESRPLLLGLVVAPRRLDAQDDDHHLLDEPRGVAERVGAAVDPLLDEFHVEDVGDGALLARPGQLGDPVAHLGEHPQHPRVARCVELEVVDQRVPERPVERLADSVEHGVADVAAAGLVEPELGVEEELVRQLLVGHSPGERRVPSTGGRCCVDAGVGEGPGEPVRVELVQRLLAGDLLELAAEPVDLRAELDLELAVGGLVGWKVPLRLVERDERVPDAAGELRLVGDLPRLEPPQVLEQRRRELLGQRRRDHLEVPERRLHERVAHGVELVQHRHRALEQRLLHRAHGLEHVRRTVGDHVGGQKHPHVDVLRRKGLGGRSVAERRQEVHPLERRPHGGDQWPLAERDHERLERDRLEALPRDADRVDRAVEDLGRGSPGEALPPVPLDRLRGGGVGTRRRPLVRVLRVRHVVRALAAMVW